MYVKIHEQLINLKNITSIKCENTDLVFDNHRFELLIHARGAVEAQTIGKVLMNAIEFNLLYGNVFLNLNERIDQYKSHKDNSHPF